MSTYDLKKPSFMHIFLKGEAVSAFWNFATKAVGIINTFLTITALSLYQYGVFQLLLSFAGMSSDVLGLGSAVITNEIIRAVSEGRTSEAKRLFLEYTAVRVIISVIIWAFVYFGAPILFRSYNIDFIKDMRVISFLFITEVVFMMITVFCQAKLQFGLIALRPTLNKLIQLSILIFFFTQGNLGLKQLIWSVVISSGLSVLIVLIPTFKVYREWKDIKLAPRVIIWGIFVKYGVWDTVRQFVNKIIFRVKPWLIKLFISTEAVAIFSIAEIIVSTLQDILPSKTLQSLVPMWVNDEDLSSKMFSYGVKYFILAGLAISIGAVIVVPLVVHTFFAKYNASIPLFYFMIVNLPIFASGILIGNYTIALRRQKFLFFHNVSRSILTLGILLLTIPYIGLWGLAIEFVIVPLFMVIFTYLYTKHRKPGFHFDFNIIFGFTSEDREIIKKIFYIIRGWFTKRELTQ